MKRDVSKLSEPSRDDLIQAISHAMLFQGKRRQHHWDGLNAKVAAEKLIDGLASANYVILRGPSAPAHGPSTGRTADAERADE